MPTAGDGVNTRPAFSGGYLVDLPPKSHFHSQHFFPEINGVTSWLARGVAGCVVGLCRLVSRARVGQDQGVMRVGICAGHLWCRIGIRIW
jgi:hypothetical protein